VIAMPKAMGKANTKSTAPKKSMMTKQEAEDNKYLCYCCGNKRARSNFYMSTDPFNSVGIIPYCKDCLEKIARNYNNNYKEFGDVTKASLMAACERMDVPYLEKVWEGSYKEVNDPSLKKPKTNIWAAYVTNIKLPQYNGLRWRDGDLFRDSGEEIHSDATVSLQNEEILEEYEKNRKDVIRLIGYDPFDKEAEEDKPLLYAQLIGYIDGDGNNDDMTRILDCIEIVRGYLQLQKINDMSAKAFANLAKTGQSGEIKNYMATKKQIADVIKQLAEQSCISQKHNKDSKKGENTWTGKIKMLKDLNLREAENNGFDIGTCRGMQQVLEISDASIMKQLALDESEWSDMVAEQRARIVKLQSERDVYKEVNRILLRENIDLRDTLSENDLLDESNLQNLKQLFSAFAEIEKEEDDDIDLSEETPSEVEADE
jgi:hypothetical protein